VTLSVRAWKVERDRSVLCSRLAMQRSIVLLHVPWLVHCPIHMRLRLFCSSSSYRARTAGSCSEYTCQPVMVKNAPLSRCAVRSLHCKQPSSARYISEDKKKNTSSEDIRLRKVNRKVYIHALEKYCKKKKTPFTSRRLAAADLSCSCTSGF
jgi:hypothetical protein